MRAALRRAASSVEDSWRWLLGTEGLLFGPEALVCPTWAVDPPLPTRLRRLRFPLRRSTLESGEPVPFPRPDLMEMIDLCIAFFIIWQHDSMVR